jgi:hypothetical protein
MRGGTRAFLEQPISMHKFLKTANLQELNLPDATPSKEASSGS